MVGLNKYDVLYWVIRIIESCKTKAQLDAAKNLIKAYNKKFDIAIWDPEGDILAATYDAQFDKLNAKLKTIGH